MLARLVCLLTFLAFTTPAFAGNGPIDDARSQVDAVRQGLHDHEADFDELLALRERLDPVRGELRDLLAGLGKKHAFIEQRLKEIGSAPADPAAPESEALQKTRAELQRGFAAMDDDVKQASVILGAADGLSAHIADLRREAFANRILLHSASPLTPDYWIKLYTRGLPVVINNSRRVAVDEAAHIAAAGTTKTVASLGATLVCLLALYGGVRRWLARRASAERPSNTGFDRRVAVRHAFFVLLKRSIPLPLMMGLLSGIVEYFDLSSDVVDLLIERIAIAVLTIGVSRGIMAALLSPGKAHLRLVLCADETARAIYTSTIVATNVFVLGILLTAYAEIVSAPNSIIVTISLLVALGVIASFGVGLFILRDRPAAPATALEMMPPTGASGPVALSLGWIRPLIVLTLLIGVGAVVAGYITLAGFLMSRLTVVVLAVSLAILLSLFIEEAFGNILTSRAPKGRAVAHAIGISGPALDLLSTTAAGFLRLLVVCVALVFAFGPWGIRFGDINPFNDALFAFSFAYIRFSLGTVSFALFTFVIGLIGTRLIVGWLDRRLLPLTGLDPGVRNSMTTVLGYVGFAITVTVVLAQLGVNPQNVTVVAGALSVGIGFGLQAITSNFISGLIVLAERPIRVGDIIAVKGEEGRVKKISVRSTLIGGFDRTDIIVPNTDILTSIVRNKSLSDREARLKLNFLMDRDADPDVVGRIILAAAGGQANVKGEPSVFFVKTSPVGLEFELRCLVNDLDHVDRVGSDLNFQIVRDFRAKGIRLAYLTDRDQRAPTETSGPHGV